MAERRTAETPLGDDALGIHTRGVPDPAAVSVLRWQLAADHRAADLLAILCRVRDRRRGGVSRARSADVRDRPARGDRLLRRRVDRGSRRAVEPLQHDRDRGQRDRAPVQLVARTARMRGRPIGLRGRRRVDRVVRDDHGRSRHPVRRAGRARQLDRDDDRLRLVVVGSANIPQYLQLPLD